MQPDESFPETSLCLKLGVVQIAGAALDVKANPPVHGAGGKCAPNWLLQTARHVSAKRRRRQRQWSNHSRTLGTVALVLLAAVLVIVVLFVLDNIANWFSNLNH